MNFTQFLEKKFVEEHPAVLDDDLPDHFDNWLTELQVDEWIKLGDEFKTSPNKEVSKLEKLPSLTELIK